MRKCTFRSCCLLLSVLVLCAVSLSAFSIYGSASSVGSLLREQDALVLPHSIQLQTDDYYYDFQFDESFWTESTSASVLDGSRYVESLTYDPNEGEEIGYFYKCYFEQWYNDTEESLNIRFDREYSTHGFIWIPEQDIFFDDIRRMTIDSYDGEYNVEIRRDSTGISENLYPTGNIYIGTKNFEYLYELENLNADYFDTYTDGRYEITITRTIVLQHIEGIGDRGLTAHIWFDFYGMGLIDSQGYSKYLSIWDDSAIICKNDTAVAYSTSNFYPYVSAYNGNDNTTVEMYGGLVKATGYTTELDEQEVGDVSILTQDYYQTYINTSLAYDSPYNPLPYDNAPFYNLVGGYIKEGDSFPTYENNLATYQYIEMAYGYDFNGYNIEQYIRNLGNEIKGTRLILNSIPVVDRRTDSLVFESGVKWGWLDVDFSPIGLTSFLDGVTQFFLEDIFGVFSIADILALVIGICLLFALLKFFLGG